MLTLVTGATGAVGVPLVQALLERGDTVRVLVRPEGDVDVLPDADIDILDGDITDREDVAEAVKGCERVFHLAGLFRDSTGNDAEFFDVNVGGTVNVLQAALDEKLKRVVYVSAASTIGEARGETGTEETEHRGYFLSAYERSKWESEQFVAEFVEKGVPVVTVNPSLVFGPGDSEHNGGRLTGLLNGVITASVDAPAAYIFVKDLIRGIIAADEKGRPGERYLLSGTNTTRIDFLRTAAAVAGVKPSLRVASSWQLKMFLWIEWFRGRFSKRAPALTRSAIETALHGASYDSSKAERELGVTFTPMEDGLDETIEWLYQEGRIELPDTVVPGEGRPALTATARSGGAADDDWEWVEAEVGEVVEEEEEEWEEVEVDDGEPLPKDDEEWEWEEVEEEEEDAGEEAPATASAEDDDEWEWVEVAEGEAPEDDDEWEWEEVDDEDAESDAGPEEIGQNGDNQR